MSDLSKRLHRLSLMDPLADVNSAPEKRKPQVEKPEKPKKEQSAEDFISSINSQLDSISDTLGFDDSFDDFIELIGDNDEDLQLKNTMLSLGKKYNREHIIDDNDTRNAVEKAFGPQERELKEFKDGLLRDVKDIDEIIFSMKASRSRNTKTLSDLMEVRNSTKGHILAAIKETNNIQKTKFDIAAKQQKNESNNDDMFANANLAVQQLLTTGRQSLIDSVGGREGSSGAYNDDDDDPYSALNDSFSVEQMYMEDDMDDPNEGDLFIKYENSFDHYQLTVKDDGSYGKVYAIDKDGDIIPDYPVPEDTSDLRFKVDNESAIASDQLNRRYHLVHENAMDDTIF